MISVRNYFTAVVVVSLVCVGIIAGQQRHGERNFVLISKGGSLDDIVRLSTMVVPSPRQMAWQELEFTAFVHFTMNTFTDREWGLGTEPESLFNPTSLDARQWAKVCRDAGMKMIIITAKHHDGFCLWPSKYTDHSVKNSPWRNGKGDVLKEVSDACREFGLKFGVYLSPWDRHEKSYGDSPAYNEHFKNQLRELLTDYGEVSEVWFDGANGEGPNGRRQVYDWKGYYAIIRSLQPNAVIFGMGPDVRWVGTESGYGRTTEWSVLPDIVQNLDSIATSSQQNPVDGAFVPGDLTNEDLGSREKLRNAKALVWYPAEVDVSIRPGWFYHASEDNQVKTPEKLLDIYYSSAGRNAVLLLNLPPDRRGLINENDVSSLKEMRRILEATFRINLASNAQVKASSEQRGHEARYLIDKNARTYWTIDRMSSSPSVTFDLGNPQMFDVIKLQENILMGQRVESFVVEAWEGNSWQEIAGGTTIGYMRLLRLKPTTASKVRLTISQARWSPAISEFGLYLQPPTVEISPVGGAFLENTEVSLSSNLPNTIIRYTINGREPDFSSAVYKSKLTLGATTVLKAFAYTDDTTRGLTSTAMFSKAEHGIVLLNSFSPNYPGGGAQGLVDGIAGSTNLGDPAWQGYEGLDLIAVVDLRSKKPIELISSGFLQDVNSWIFFPEYVEYSFSDDGKVFSNPTKIVTDISKRHKGAMRTEFKARFTATNTRYVRIRAKNIGTCPPWHPGAGGKAWVFADEVTIR